MKKSSKVSLIIIVVFVISSIFLVVYSFTYKYFEKEKPVPCPSYCEEVSKQISDLDLEGFKYIEAEDERKEGVYFRFKSEDNYDELYDDDDCLDDIIKIKNVISTYLSSHKNEKIHDKTIRLAFFGEIGNRIQIYNYEKSGIPPEEVFAYYDEMYITPDYFDKFKEAKRIGIKITDDDDLAKLADYTELKMLYIYGENEISQDTIDTVVKMLPNCEVRYREDTYGRIK